MVSHDYTNACISRLCIILGRGAILFVYLTPSLFIAQKELWWWQNYGKAFGAKIYTDKNGYRIEKNQINKEGQEILFIGGSVTFGPGVKANNTFVELLNKKSVYNIKNASVFGTNLENNIKIIKNKKNNHKNIKKVFINFPLDDILSEKIELNENKNKT